MASILWDTFVLTVRQANHGSPSKSFCVSATADSIMTMLSLIVLNEGNKLVKKAYAETERKYTSSGFTCTFPTMTIMTDKSPRHTTPVAYKKR